MSALRAHLTTLPADLAKGLDDTYQAVIDHYLKDEPDDAQVDAGRFCEAALRYLEWKMKGSYTPIDGRSKPNRKRVVNAAQADTALEPTLRAQVPQIIELVMDFRNNRNSAHLGNIDPNNMDAATVVQNVTWVIGEIARIESNKSIKEIQALLDRLAERKVPLVQTIGDTPIVLHPTMEAADKALVLLHQSANPVPVNTLRTWARYGNHSRWRHTVLAGLEKKTFIYVDGDDLVHILHPGEAEAERILRTARPQAA